MYLVSAAPMLRHDAAGSAVDLVARVQSHPLRRIEKALPNDRRRARLIGSAHEDVPGESVLTGAEVPEIEIESAVIEGDHLTANRLQESRVRTRLRNLEGLRQERHPSVGHSQTLASEHTRSVPHYLAR
jgi:hypothetical protein